MEARRGKHHARPRWLLHVRRPRRGHAGDLPPGGGPHRPDTRLREAPRRRQDHGHRPARAEKARRADIVSDTKTSPPRILLFTGKGGVGKTTTAAAMALRC